MNVYFPANEQNGKKNETRNVETILEQMQKNNFSHILATLNIRNMTREYQDCSRRRSCAPKCYGCEVNFFAVAIVKVKSISLAVTDGTNVH